jgi:uncharacterized membrane protein
MKLAIGEIELEVDLLRDFETINKLEAQAGLSPDSKAPTPQLLLLVGKWLESMGVVDCTASVAWQVWWLSYEMADALRKRFQIEAELTFWYKIDAFKLTDLQKIGLRENLTRVKAQTKLENGQFDPLDHIAVYNLYLAATGDEAQALLARAKSQEAYLDATSRK